MHQVWSLAAVQFEFDVTLNEVLPENSDTAWLEGKTDNVGAVWVTVTTIGVNPATVTVIFATLWTDVLLSV